MRTIPISQALLDFIFFTGSTKVGKIVMKAAAENLTPVLLELGGQNPALVDETANIADAARKIVWGAMAWGGQWCTSPGYAYVHESVADAFVAETKKALIDLYGPDPKTNPDYSRVINAREVSRLAALIDSAKVTAGGRSDPDARYLDPTILYPVTWDDPIMEDEVFGPILPILAYRTLDEALARIAATPHPLAAFVFSRDQKTIDRFISQLSYGRRRGEPGQHPSVHRIDAVRRNRRRRHWPLLRKIRVRHADPCQVNARCATRRSDRPPLSSYTKAKNEELPLWFEY